MKLLALALLALAALGRSQTLPLIPAPQHLKVGKGKVAFSSSTPVYSEGLNATQKKLVRTTLGLEAYNGFGPESPAIRLRVNPNRAAFGAEGYQLRVDEDGASVEAATVTGVLHAVQTLRQMLPPTLEAGPGWEGEVPYAEIRDEPKFRWRGLHLDVSRHFFGKEFILRYLDLMALAKLNVFHWHLVDDGGWRLEIDRFPELTRRGAWRAPMDVLWAQSELAFPEPGSGDTYGGFYTKQDVREIVAYAAERGITVVPEIEMPGHTQPVMWAYPELACEGTTNEESLAHNGNQRPNVYCAGQERTFEFIENVLDEVLELFPSTFIHIGGDEVDKFLWSRCPRCQARMAAEGLKDEKELQSYFIRRVEAYLRSNGRRLIGWDEILEGGLAPGATVMSWRGMGGGIEAARSAHEVVMSPTSHSYFDYSYSAIDTATAFGFDPVPAELSPLEARYVLGGQANVWTEWLDTEDKIERMVFPRLLGMSEALWTGDPQRNFNEFRGRLRGFFPRLDALSVNYLVPVPEAAFDAVLLDPSAEVSFLDPPVEGGMIRYTTDGSVPTAASRTYGAPLRITEPCVVTAALFLPGGAYSEPIRVSCVRAQPVGADGLVPGLALRVARGAFKVCPDFGSLADVSAPASVETVSLGEWDDQENFALEFTGYLRIAREGVYTFSTNSDDGSYLEIAGAKVVDNDGLHGPAERSGRIRLKPGLYPFKVCMFEASGGDVLEVTMAGPGMERGPLDPANLFRLAE